MAAQQIMSLEALKNSRIKYACEDGSREFISLLAYLSVDGTTIPPLFIYKGESHSLQDTVRDRALYRVLSLRGLYKVQGMDRR